MAKRVGKLRDTMSDKSKSKPVGNNKPIAAQSSASGVNIALLLSVAIVLTWITYWSVFDNDFVNWDDDRYVTNNPNIEKVNAKLYFSEPYYTMYIPITMVSLGIDFQLGNSTIKNINPRPYHVTSFVLHVINVCLVFWFVLLLLRMYKQTYQANTLSENNIRFLSFFVAVVFALHPQHVESVAWVSERKDLLYAAFYWLALIMYLFYLQHNKFQYLGAAVVLMLLSLLSKTQAISLPLALVAIDWFARRNIFSIRVIAEKIPFGLLSLVFGIVGVQALSTDEMVGSAPDFPYYERFVYACYATTMYFIKSFVPFHLSIIHSYPQYAEQGMPAVYWLSVIPALLLVVFIVYAMRKWKLVGFGLLFFAANIVFVLQLFSYHNFVMADRYSYIPSVGVSLLLVALYERRFITQNSIVLAIATGYLIFLGVYAFSRVDVWQNSISLWNDLEKKYEYEHITYYNRGNEWERLGNLDKAINDYSKALLLKPNYMGAMVNRGIAYGKTRNWTASINDLNRAIELNPNFSAAHSNRGNACIGLAQTYENKQQYDSAKYYYQQADNNYSKALELDSAYLDALFNRGLARLSLGNNQGCVADFTRYLRFDKQSVLAYYNLGMAYARQNLNDEALQNFSAAIQLDARNVDAYYFRALVYENLKNLEAAIKDYSSIIGLRPELSRPFYNRGICYIRSNDRTNGCSDFQKALQLGEKQAAVALQQYCK